MDDADLSSAKDGVRPILTIAICTRDRPQALRQCLESLTGQIGGEVALLVVDNAPRQCSVRDLVSECFPEASYVLERRPGLDFARNRALRSSETELLAFLDDDTIASSEWAATIIDVFAANPGSAALTGPSPAAEIRTEAQRLFEANGGLGRNRPEERVLPRDAHRMPGGMREPDFLGALSIGVGCNMALRRQAAIEAGGFDEALGVGTLLPGGDENDLFWRLIRAGHEVRYDPSILVHHMHRTELHDMTKQLAGYQLGGVAWLTKVIRQSRGLDRWSAIAFTGWCLVRPGLRLLKRGVGRDPLPGRVLLSIWKSSWKGLWSYPRSVREVRRIRRDSA